MCIRNANDDQKIIGNIDSFFGEKNAWGNLDEYHWAHKQGQN